MFDLNGGYWDLEVFSVFKESVIFRFDNLFKNEKNKEMNFYVCLSLKDLKKGVVVIDFGIKSMIVSYMDKMGIYCLFFIGCLVDDVSLIKFENFMIMEFRYKENFCNVYDVLDYCFFIEKNDIEVVYEVKKNVLNIKGNDLYWFFF